jgi:hypothetical protein
VPSRLYLLIQIMSLEFKIELITCSDILKCLEWNKRGTGESW